MGLRRIERSPSLMASAALRVGVVGTGYGAAVLIPAIRSTGLAEVAAVCARTPGKARQVADKLLIPKAFDRWEDLVADPDLQAVAIAVPPDVQPLIAKEALQNGKHLFLEKPVAMDLERAKELQALASRRHLTCAVDFEFLECAPWISARRLIHEGKLGEVAQILVNWQVETYSSRMKLLNWKTSPSGGALNLFMSHAFYYVEKLAGPFVRLFAASNGIPGGHAAETNLYLLGELASGARAAVSIGTASIQGSGHRVEIYGSRGSLVLENVSADYIAGFSLRYALRNEDRKLIAFPEESAGSGAGVDGRIGATASILTRFFQAIVSGAAAEPSLPDGIRVQELMEWTKQSCAHPRWIEATP
ncbi:MAG: Gfo/Idh/MocA family oxidoreductase [Planctomycetota bacterium]|nr:Gfo/Idh/MocA family oxidoreductase [Planctomycetota bacterium]